MEFGNRMKAPKYRNKAVVIAGIRWDSQREYARWCELKMLERAHKVSGLERQVTYKLADGVKFEGAKRAQPPLRIKVDFRYFDMEACQWILEDLKSPASVTTAFTIRRHLLLAIHNQQIRLSA